MTKFIIFTDNNAACFPTEQIENPFNFLTEGASFGNRGNTVGVISLKENLILPNPSDFIREYKDYDILLLADKVFDETANYVSYVKAFVDNEQDVHVLIHKGRNEQKDVERKNYQKKLIKTSLGEDFENFGEQNHSSTSIYWNEFKEIAQFISTQPKEEKIYQTLLSKLKSKFPNPQLSSIIHLHKSLVLIHFNIKDADLNETTLKNELSKIKELKKDKAKLAFNKYKTEDFTPINLNSKISEIEKEIIKLYSNQ